jgi:hypothetical protein
MTSGPWIGSLQKKTGWWTLESQIIVTIEHAYKVESDDIIVSLSGVEFDGKSTWVTG